MYIYPRISNATIWSTSCQCLLSSSGGGCAAVVAAAQLLQPGESKKNHDARAGLLVVQWGQQGWAGWGGQAELLKTVAVGALALVNGTRKNRTCK